MLREVEVDASAPPYVTHMYNLNGEPAPLAGQRTDVEFSSKRYAQRVDF